MSVGPLAERSLDEAFGFAVGLWSVRSGEAVLEAEGRDGGSHGVGAVAGAVVGVDAFGLDAELLEEGERGVEEGDGTVSSFVREELSEGEAGVIVDGDVEELPAGPARVVVLAITSDAMAGARDARELFDVEMDEIAGMFTLVAADRWRRFQSRETGRMTAEQA